MKNADKIINGESYHRSAGILMPIFSLPSDYGIGDMGPKAYQFIRYLKEAGQTLWGILPLGPTGYCNSPYKALSVFAGNPYFISPELLCKEGLVSKDILKRYDFGSNPSDIDYKKMFDNRISFLRQAFENWKKTKKYQEDNFKKFKKKNVFWLKNYALYMSIKEFFSFKPWNLWPDDIRDFRPEAVKKYGRELKEDILFWYFIQYEFENQWYKLKKYANDNGIKLIGDMPFYVEYDSADVWSGQNLFEIDEKTKEIVVSAGVPGDVFSSDVRCWGMPCYNWNELQKYGYSHHLQRFKYNLKMYDILRVDHAIGFVRYYGIRKGKGEWYEGPDFNNDVLIPKFSHICKKYGKELIAEDLGSVPERAYNIFQKYHWAGTRVLQFGFANRYGTETIHLPFYYPHKSVAYTGTHDNPTLKSYIEGLSPKDFSYMQYYIHTKKCAVEYVQKKMIEILYQSASEKVLIPLGDILGFDNKARISFGAEYQKSWRWRLKTMSEFSKVKRIWLKKMAFAYARIPFNQEEAERYGWK